MTRSTPASTSVFNYDDDFFAWTQEQAAALRRLPNEAVGDAIDIAHVAEEIEDLGKRDLREVASFLARLFEHLMKINSSPASRDVPHWSEEARLFQSEATGAFSPSMRRAIDLAVVWRKTRKRKAADLEAIGVTLIAQPDCPFALDELLADDFDLQAALAKLAVVPPSSA